MAVVSIATAKVTRSYWLFSLFERWEPKVFVLEDHANITGYLDIHKLSKREIKMNGIIYCARRLRLLIVFKKTQNCHLGFCKPAETLWMFQMSIEYVVKPGCHWFFRQCFNNWSGSNRNRAVWLAEGNGTMNRPCPLTSPVHYQTGRFRNNPAGQLKEHVRGPRIGFLKF